MTNISRRIRRLEEARFGTAADNEFARGSVPRALLRQLCGGEGIRVRCTLSESLSTVRTHAVSNPSLFIIRITKVNLAMKLLSVTNLEIRERSVHCDASEERKLGHNLKRNQALATILFFAGMPCLRADMFFVTGTTPASGALVQPPTSITVDLNQAVDPATVSVPSLTLNGVAASLASLNSSGTALTYSFTTSPIPAGDRVSNTINVSGFKDLSGTTVAPFSDSFFTDSVPPSVVSDSIPNGSILPPGNLTDVVTFSEPINVSATTAASFDLHGSLHAVDYSPVSFSWDATDTVLTINYLALPVDNYTETLFGSGFQDLVGLDLASDVVTNFCLSTSSTCPTSIATPEASSLLLLGICILGITLVSLLKARYRHPSR